MSVLQFEYPQSLHDQKARLVQVVGWRDVESVPLNNRTRLRSPGTYRFADPTFHRGRVLILTRNTKGQLRSYYLGSTAHIKFGFSYSLRFYSKRLFHCIKEMFALAN